MKRGTITFVFDDGFQEILDDVVPLMDKLEFPGVFAIPLNAKNLDHWVKHLALPHELAAHSVSHKDLTTLSEQDLDTELRKPADKLDASTLIYPGGAYNEEVINSAKKYYKAARTTDYGFEKKSPENSMILKTVNYSKRNWNLYKANLRVLWAWLANKWLLETYHLITNEESDYEFTVPLRDFRKHLDFVSKLDIEVKTVSDVIVVPNNK